VSLLIGLGALGAAVAAVLWVVAAIGVRPLIAGDRFLHQTTVYLTVVSLVGLDLLLVGAIFQVLPGELAQSLFGIVMGIQVVASLSAGIFVRAVSRERAHG